MRARALDGAALLLMNDGRKVELLRNDRYVP
jgi:hypothetical protein